MSKKRKPPADSRKLPLWMLGLLCIIAGPLANILLGLIWPLGPLLTNEQRGQAFGRGLASILFIVGGFVLIVLHFVRRPKA